MANPFEKLHHICLVVEDLDEAVAYFESIGVTGWQSYPPLSDYVEVSIERDTFDTLDYRFTKLDNLQLQLCHPRPGDTPQRHFLETRGPGVYHLAFAAPDVDESERAALESGLAILGKGRRQDGSGFTYFDTEDEIGVTLNVRTPT